MLEALPRGNRFMRQLCANRRTPKTGHHSLGLCLNIDLIAESGQPGDVGLVAKPCHLAFRVVAMGLLGGGDGGVAGKGSAKELNGLPVAERTQWPSRVSVFRKQAF